MSSTDAILGDVKAQFDDQHHDLIDDDAARERIESLAEYDVPRGSIVDNVVQNIADENGIATAGDAMQVADISEAEEWGEFTLKIIEHWEPNSDSIAQVGLAGDETGTIKFTVWAKADHIPHLEEGEVYTFENAVTDYYEPKDQYSIKLHSKTGVTHMENTEMEVGSQDIEASGVISEVSDGLIKRCPHEDCSRTVGNGSCQDHGQVDGEFDLRLKAVMEVDADTSLNLVFNRDQTEAILDMDLDEAIALAQDALDTSIVGEKAAGDLVGEYMNVTVSEIQGFHPVQEYAHLGTPDTADVADVREALAE